MKKEKDYKITQDLLESKNELINQVIKEVKTKIIGQDKLIKNLLIGLLTGGHILLEGVPGVAKTLTIDTLSKTLDLDFKRVQFTPDLLPSDLIGAEIYNQAKSTFETKLGPVNTNFLLADEINRAPAKVQSALLEAMAEGQITLGDDSYKLPSPFIVLATQNPIEQSGTYKLPEAELDRFMLKSYVNYPDINSERKILENIKNIENKKINKILNIEEIKEIKELIGKIHISENIIKYITDIIFKTRENNAYLSYGVSPRGSIALLKASKVIAFLNNRDFVIPEDIKEVAVSVLSHRLVLNYEALSENITEENIILDILDKVKV